MLATLNILHTFFNVSIVEFEQVNVSWVIAIILKTVFLGTFWRLDTLVL